MEILERADNPRWELRKEVADAFLYAHSRLNSNTSRTLESSAFLYALVELLGEKGLISIEELDDRKRIVGERLASQYREDGAGVALQDPEIDKYKFQGEAKIDCASKIHVCHAACCRLPLALSKQDVTEGIVRWDLGRPYLIAHNQDGYCYHLDRDANFCTVREHRPVPCRAYDCRADRRIWLDFEGDIANPEILNTEWPFSGKDGKEGA